MAVLAECPKCHNRSKVAHKKCPKCESSLTRAPSAVLDDNGFPDEKKIEEYGKAVNFSRYVKFWIVYTTGGKQKWENAGYSYDIARTKESKRRVQRHENPRILQKVPEERMTFRELTDWYLGLEKVKALAYYLTLKINLASFNKVFGDYLISKIKPADLENFQARQKAAGYADAYVDHHLGAAKVVVNKAFDNDLVSGETVKVFKRVKKLLKRNANARDRILTMDEFESIMNHAAPHVRMILATGFYTGMRRGEILGLTWDKIDMENRIIQLEAQDTKDREPRKVPICQELFQILKQVPRAIHDNHVFLYRGKPVASIKTGLIRACRDASIEYGRFAKNGFILHDTRHCFNTYMRKAGVAESVIMSITGHSTRTMFDRYNTIDAKDAQDAVGQLEGYLSKISKSIDKQESRESKTGA